MRQRRAAPVTGLLVEVNAEGFASLEPDRALGEAAQPQLWSLQIGEDAYRTSRGAFNFADRGETVLVVLVGSMAEVEPEYVHPCFEQIPDPLRRRTRWAKCRDNLGAAQAPRSHLHIDRFS